MRWPTCVVLAISFVMSAASLALTARRESVVAKSSFRPTPSLLPLPADVSHQALAEDDLGFDRVPGQVEAIPQNVFHVVPYNDWPLFELAVMEGQRLKFERKNGRWEGDHDSLTIQFETPAEIDTKKEEIEIARIEKQAAEIAEDILEDELQKGLEAAIVRETNARQESDRLEKLRNRTAATDQEAQRARSLLDLARVQREQADVVRQKRLAQARLQTQAAEHRLRRAESEYQLADFKREMSWGNVPHRRHSFEEVVVTRVSAAIGDVPSGSGKRDAWVEVIDDRELRVRSFLAVADLDRIAVGKPVQVNQEARSYPGTVAAINIVADATTHRVPVLVKVKNSDRKLKVNTLVTVDFLH